MADFCVFPVAVRPKSGLECRFPARTHYRTLLAPAPPPPPPSLPSLTDRNTNPRHATPKRTRGAIATPACHAQERQLSTCKSGPKQHVQKKMQVILSQRLQTTLSFVLCHKTSTSEHVTAKYDSGHRRVPGQGSPFASSGKDRGNTCTSERYDLIVSDVSALLDGSAWAKSRTSQTQNFPEDFVFLCLWPAP